ncbi:tetraspanin-31 isoform X2 [Zootermopsis nevadensis]|uniref:tetraspanin-31 isoform X2 n=1 Tax=Zootermopsis nevadensis TaxID=136037 RepID=UPI000B8E8B81|nr:tetraspanin-31 isoform X2 [Zootermopsis nevadensis]
MCGGFTCSKNALTALNILYILVAFILIGVAVYGRASAVVTNLPIVGGILACGVFLILISILGLIGAIKHHQVLLFFYMLILFLLFLVQFSIACACLAFNAEQQHQLAEQGWNTVASDIKHKVQKMFDCCEIDHNLNDISIPSSTPVPQDKCETSCCNGGCPCQSCMKKLQSTINYAFNLCGGIGLFFSFTERFLLPPPSG